MFLKKFAAAAALAIISPLSNPAYAAVTVGTPGNGNTIPFFSNIALNYEQVYTSSAFNSPITISSFTMFNDGSSANPTLPVASFVIKFYLTSVNPGSLSTDFTSNRGSLLSNFGTFNFNGGALPADVTFNGTDFTYNPADGNLLIDISATFTSKGLGGFQSDGSGLLMSRAYNTGVTGTDSTALVTRFNEVSAAVPEPATWALMLAGFAFVGWAMRKQRQTAQARLRVVYN